MLQRAPQAVTAVFEMQRCLRRLVSATQAAAAVPTGSTALQYMPWLPLCY